MPGGISPVFVIEPYDLRPFQVEVVRNYKTGVVGGLITQTLRERKIPLDEIHITNTENIQRYVRIVEKRQGANATIVMNNALGRPWPKFDYFKSDLILVAPEIPSGWNHSIDPGKTLKLNLVLMTQPFTCTNDPQSHPASSTIRPVKPYLFRN